MNVADIEPPDVSSYHDLLKPIKIYYREIYLHETIYFHITDVRTELVSYIVTNKNGKEIVIKPSIFTIQNLPETVRDVHDTATQEWENNIAYELHIKNIIQFYTQSLALMEILNNYCKVYEPEKKYFFIDVQTSIIQCYN